jgi:RNA recognition motif-containing protein
MNSKLYVGGIPYTSTNDDLKAHFSAAGNVVSAQIIIDKMTNRSKGFGFVEMSSDAEAEKAISMFHDQEFQGRRLTVNIARPLAPREDRPRRAF